MSINDENTDLAWDIVDDEHVSVSIKGMKEQELRYVEEEDALYMSATDPFWVYRVGSEQSGPRFFWMPKGVWPILSYDE
ncbi:MAG: hypothetical protein U0J70_02295 [Atopobiaceae bacterium]|nr:hypothetical protein [Atopobiaceae bacterium]